MLCMRSVSAFSKLPPLLPLKQLQIESNVAELTTAQR